MNIKSSQLFGLKINYFLPKPYLGRSQKAGAA
jgi:hypothetical protein